MAGEISFSGIVAITPSTAGKCGLVIAPGTEPTLTEGGGVWYDAGLDCLAFIASDGTTTYFPKGMGNAGQVLSSNGDGVPTWVTPTDVDLAIGGADKQLQYNNNGAFGGVSNGNADEVLVSNGAAAIPSFKVFGKLLHGVIPPVDLTDGVNGDFFLDTATSTLYGPKAGGAWPGGVSIIGAQGIQGVQGIPGAAGTGFLYQSIKQNSIVTNVTTLQTLVSFDAFAAGLMNVLGRRLIIKGKGFFNTAGGETPTIRLDVYMAAASRASITSSAVTAGLTDSPFEYEFVFQTSVIGASGKLITSATMLMSLDGTTYTNYMSIPSTDTSAFDLTGVFGPAVTVTCGGTALTNIDVRSSIAQVS